MSRVMVRATNWLGDAVMSLPAIRAIRGVFPQAHLAVVAKPWVADLYAREKSIDRVIPYTAKTFGDKRAFAARLRRERFDGAILLQNAFDAALMAWMAGIPERIGYRRDGRGFLLTRAIPVPEPGDIPRHERFYYLELLRRAGMLERFPAAQTIQLDGADLARESGVQRLRELGIQVPPIGISPGAAYGNAKRWLPERFAEVAARLSRTQSAPVLFFGSQAERQLCEAVECAASRGRNRGAESRGRNVVIRIHRSGSCLPRFRDQRFGRHAYSLGSRRSNRGCVRGYRRLHYRADRAQRPHRPRARRMQPMPAARVPHRPPVHDAR